MILEETVRGEGLSSFVKS